MSDYLIHYGTKGQKWGKRNYQNPDGSLTPAGELRYNKRYKSEQRRRDVRVYGTGGMKRINRSMNNGSGLMEARSKEARRIYRHRRAGRWLGTGGRLAGGAAAGYAAYKNADKIADEGAKIVGRITQNRAMFDLTYDALHSPQGKAAISAGSAFLGNKIGMYGGQSIGMLSGGYNPKKFRYS